jgi:hypothetical protein
VTVTRVQFASSSITSTGLTVTLGSATTAGNLLVIAVSVDGTVQTPAVTLVGSTDTFVQDASATNTNPIANIGLSLWSDPNCSGGHTQINVHVTSSAGLLVAIWEVSGSVATSPLAGTAAAAGPTNTLQSSFDSSAGTGVVPGCFWVGAVTGVGSGGRAQALPTGSWTTEVAIQPGSASQMLGAYQAGMAFGTPQYRGTFTAPVAGAYWAAITAAYKPAPTPSSGVAMASGII